MLLDLGCFLRIDGLGLRPRVSHLSTGKRTPQRVKPALEIANNPVEIGDCRQNENGDARKQNI